MKSKVNFICSFSIFLLFVHTFSYNKISTFSSPSAKQPKLGEKCNISMYFFLYFTVNISVVFLFLLANKRNKKKSYQFIHLISPIVNHRNQYLPLVFSLLLSVSLQCNFLYVFFSGHQDFTKTLVISYSATMTSILSKCIPIYLYYHECLRF